MSDTPRTDEAQFGTGRVSVDFARQLERELNAINVEIEEKRKDIVYLATEKAKLEDYVMRLEEENNELRAEEARLLNTNGELERRIKRLEDRIHRAAMAFFSDGSDGQVASQMLQILEEERRQK